MGIGNHKDLIVWQKAMDLVVRIYQLTDAFPKQENCRIAFGSASELETQLEIADRLNYGDKAIRTICSNLLDEVIRMLNKLTSR